MKVDKEMEEVALNNFIKQGVSALQDICYKASVDAGWHTDIRTGKRYTQEQEYDKFPERIALIHSEVTESLHGFRKDLMDDKLPHRNMPEVELADVIIRTLNLAGTMGYDVAGAIIEKIKFNRERLDHKIENRTKEGGKKF